MISLSIFLFLAIDVKSLVLMYSSLFFEVKFNFKTFVNFFYLITVLKIDDIKPFSFLVFYHSHVK